eukprot:gene13329-28236_t
MGSYKLYTIVMTTQFYILLMIVSCDGFQMMHQSKINGMRKSSNIGLSLSQSSESAPSPERGVMKRVTGAAEVLYKFSRPHTIKGTILASSMGVGRALLENPGKFSPSLIKKALTGLLALLCGNAYIVGINQIYDVKIDEINKPFLPIAAKKLTTNQAWQLVIACLFTGVSIVKTQFSPLIFNLYMIGTILGTLYSIPPFQFKKYPLLAGGIIAIVRGFLLNFGVYYAVREALQVEFKWNPVVMFIASFMTVFASVIAVTKDLPDIEGDVKYNISTFAAKYGVKKIAGVASTVLSLTYVGAISLPFVFPGVFQILPMTLGHSALLTYFLKSYFSLDANNSSSIKKFYKSIWNLFYLDTGDRLSKPK